jgi:BirA family biotin operon repressor/biotin-[acetyl-CoA-carboxylase] ligase
MNEVAFSEAGLRDALAPRPVRFYAQVGSTNDVGLQWLGEGADEGAVVIADEQMKGRGRLGRSWYAPAGSALMFSYLLRPDAAALPRIGMLGALAVCEMIEQLGVIDAGIKWPNDVQIGRRKVCGVLPEAAWKGNTLVGVVLGIGLNVRVDFSDSSFANTAVSLETALGRRVDRADLLKLLLARLDYWRGQLSSAVLFDAWRRRLNMLNAPVTVANGGNVIAGTAEDVDDDGALLVRGADGVVRRALAGDIAMGR